MAALLVLVQAGHQPLQAWQSELFGPSWSPEPEVSFYTGKLIQDFSYAGYRQGNEPIPAHPPGPVIDPVAQFGADPSGSSDSTAALQAALDAAAAAGGGVVQMPAGTFRISPQGSNTFVLRIQHSGVVLRGAGAGQTFLLNTSHQMRGRHIIVANGPSNAAWASQTNPVTAITTDLMQPTRTIPVQDPGGFAVGDEVIVRADPGDAWATEHNENNWVGHAGSYGRLMYLRTIIAIDPQAGTLTIDVPTRYALRTRDNARVYRKNNLIREIGLEHFSLGNVQNPRTNGWGESDYQTEGTGAYEVFGHDAIRFSRVRDSWIRGVKTFRPAGNTSTCHILNNGIRLLESHAVTIDDCHFQRPQYGGAGGSGYMYRIQNSSECLVLRSVAEFSRHGFVFSSMASSGNVLHDCLDRDTARQTGASGSMTTAGSGSDHHMHFSHSNLIDTCRADNSFFTAHYRPHGSHPQHNLTAAHSVFWNTRGSGSRFTNVVHSQQSRYGYVIGTRGPVANVRTNGSSSHKTNPVDHVEGAGQGDSLEPFSLFLEQRRRRLGLPSIEGPDRVDVFHPQTHATIEPRLMFGDSTAVPVDAVFSWQQTTGPAAGGLITHADGRLTVEFLQPGDYVFTLTVSRHGFVDDGFAASRGFAVTVHPPGWQATVLTPEADAHVDAAHPGSNFGAQNTLWHKTVSSASYTRESYLRFNLAATAGRDVQQAILTMHSLSDDKRVNMRTSFVADDSWTESGLTWNNRPATGPTLVNWTPAADSIDQLDLTTRTALESAGDGLLSLHHRVVSQTDSAPIFRWASRDHANPDLHPTLWILHVLAPAQWTGNAGSGDWQVAGNWQAAAGNPLFNGQFESRLLVNGAQALQLSAAEGATAYTDPAGPGLVIGAAPAGGGQPVAGRMDIRGGSFATTGSTEPAQIGRGADATLHIDGGAFHADALNLGGGEPGHARLIITNGLAAIDTLTWQPGPGGSARLELDGGVLEIASLAAAADDVAASELRFNGGLLRITAPSFGDPFLPADNAPRLRLGQGGGGIDTGPFNFRFEAPLLDATDGEGGGPTGDLVKLGAGTLELAAGSDHTGATLVQQGRLRLAGSIPSSSLVIFQGASLQTDPGARLHGDLELHAGAHLQLPDPFAGDPGPVLLIDGQLRFTDGGYSQLELDWQGPLPLPQGDYLLAEATGGISGRLPQVTRTGDLPLPGELMIDGSRLLWRIVVIDSYQTWLQQRFTGAPTSLVNPGDDADADGVVNLLELVLDGDPLAADPSVLPRLEATDAGFEFSFTRNAEATGFTEQKVQYSADLVHWHDILLDDLEDPRVWLGEIQSGRQQVRVALDPGLAVDGRLFGRLWARLLEQGGDQHGQQDGSGQP